MGVPIALYAVISFVFSLVLSCAVLSSFKDQRPASTGVLLFALILLMVLSLPMIPGQPVSLQTLTLIQAGMIVVGGVMYYKNGKGRSKVYSRGGINRSSTTSTQSSSTQRSTRSRVSPEEFFGTI